MYVQSWIRHQEESKELDLRYDKDLGSGPDFKSVYSLNSSWIRCVQGFFPIGWGLYLVTDTFGQSCIGPKPNPAHFIYAPIDYWKVEYSWLNHQTI